MAEVTGAVIAISLVLGAVFVPVAFFPGTTGQLYKQFALTIAISVAISTFNALTLTPALSALWLKEGAHGGGKFFRPINWVIDSTRNFYTATLALVLKVKPLVLIVFAMLIGATYWLSKEVPTAFIPNEDVGYFIVILQAPEGVSVNYTLNVLKKLEKELDHCPEIVSSFGIAGFSFSGTNPNNGIVFCSLNLGMKGMVKSTVLVALSIACAVPLALLPRPWLFLSTLLPFRAWATLVALPSSCKTFMAPILVA
jgi:HAE1 family hydrophobic/amphiphilic exporter-1